MRKCTTCEVKKTEDMFFDGKSTCNRCREQHRLYYRERNLKFCKKCGNICEGKRHKYCSNKCKILDNTMLMPNGCLEWKGKGAKTHGYCSTKNYDLKNKNIMVHQLSYFLFKGEIPKGMCVCHTCDNRKCCNPDHLWLGTHSDNTKDCVEKGRHLGKAPYGSKNGSAKLIECQVSEIRKLYKEGMFQRVIAKKFNVSQATINGIVNYKTWGHIE